MEKKMKEYQTVSRDKVLRRSVASHLEPLWEIKSRFRADSRRPDVTFQEEEESLTTFDPYQSQDDERSTWTANAREWLYLQKWIEYIKIRVFTINIWINLSDLVETYVYIRLVY